MKQRDKRDERSVHPYRVLRLALQVVRGGYDRAVGGLSSLSVALRALGGPVLFLCGLCITMSAILIMLSAIEPAFVFLASGLAALIGFQFTHVTRKKSWDSLTGSVRQTVVRPGDRNVESQAFRSQGSAGFE